MIRVLMPSIVDPELQVGGAWTMTRALVRLLREGPLGAEVEIVSNPHRSRAGHLLQQWSAIGQSFVSNLPAKILFSQTRRMRLDVERFLHEGNFDLVVLNGCDLLWLLQYLPNKSKCLLVAHNIEHQLFAAQSRWHVRRAWPAARWLSTEYERLRHFEMEGLSRVGTVLFLSSADAQYVLSQFPALQSITIPPCFDDPSAPRPIGTTGTDTLHIGMLANFDWWPNRQGIHWFLQDVLPDLSPQVRIHLFGNGSGRAAPSDHRVEAHGHMPRAQDAFARCNFMICPILSGGGVCVKLAEALYHAVPVLATRFAARGLTLDPHPAIVLIDDANDWVRFINQQGRELARQKVPAEISAQFKMETHTGKLSDFIREAIG